MIEAKLNDKIIEKVDYIRLTKEGANNILKYHPNDVSNYIKDSDLIYLRTKHGLRYDPTGFEDSLYGIVIF